MTANVTIVGNLTRDPELRFTPAGAPVTTFGVAVNRRWQNRDNQQWEESTSFFNVTCWRDLAQNVSESLEKGSRVMVSGRLDQRSWETQTGERRSVVEIVADEVGPSLRWATATVNRNERRDASGGGNGWSGGGSGGSGGGGGRAVSNEPAPAYDPSEEPF
jgi:single-strand DNA-binding protein